MEQIWQWGIGVIHIVQQIRSPFFDVVFKFISSVGAVFFYIIILPPVYWCFNKRYGSRVIIIFLLSSWVNSVLKDFINHPRPYNLDESVKIGKTRGPGLPSGHAQQSLVAWGSLALWLRNRVFTFIAVTVILLIAFSRVYLGVHFPTDIIGGWIAGGIVLLLLWSLFDLIEKVLSEIHPFILSVFAIIVPSLFSMIIASRHSVMAMGALSGFCVGLVLEKKYINFESAVNFKSYIIRYFSGAFFLLLLFFSQKLIFSKSSPNYLIFVFVHSWIMFLWISAGAPWLYKKFRM